VPVVRIGAIVLIAFTAMGLAGCVDSGRNLPPDIPVGHLDGVAVVVDDRCGEASVATIEVRIWNDEAGTGSPLHPRMKAETFLEMKDGRRLLKIPELGTKGVPNAGGGMSETNTYQIILHRSDGAENEAFIGPDVLLDSRSGIEWDGHFISLDEYQTRGKCYYY